MSNFTGRIRPRALGVAAVAALALAGCGSSSSSIDKPATAADYGTSLKSICTKYNAQAAAELKSITNSTSNDTTELADIINVETPYFQKLEAVQSPSGDSDASKLRSDLSTFITQEKAAESALKAKNKSAAESAAEKLSTSGTALDTDFSNVGATSCDAD